MQLPLEQDVERGLALSHRKTTYFDRPRDDELRVLIFTACYFVLDGVTLTIRRLESHARSRGAVVKILTTAPDDLEEELRRDIIVVPGIKIPFTHAGTGYKFGSGLDENTAREIERFNPNLIHFTVPDLVALDGIKWCRKHNVAYMTTWHSNYCDYLKYYFLEWVLRPVFTLYLQGFYDQIPATYVPTPFMKDKLEREGFAKHTSLKIWGRGVDMELFNPGRRSSEFRRARGIADDDVVILWVGRLVPEKRPEIWMSVLHRLQEEGVSYKGLVVGHGAYESLMASMPNVLCTGWLSGVDLAEAYASADILLFPSAVETFGNVTLEALSSGVVCIVEENCSGHLVTNGYNGFCVPDGDTQKFYEATLSVVKDRQLRQHMTTAARESAHRYERNVILQQMLENYKTMIVEQSRPRYHEEKAASGAGNTWLSYVCCDYYLMRKLGQPVLHGMGSVSEVYYTVWDAIQSQQYFHCMEYFQRSSRSGRHEMEKKTTQSMSTSQPRNRMSLLHFVHYIAVFLAWMLVLLFVFVSLVRI